MDSPKTNITPLKSRLESVKLVFYKHILLKVFSFLFNQNNNVFLQSLYDLSQSSISDSILALSIIFLGIGIILYFFYLQFKKLSKIADEIENEEDIENSN